MDQERFREYTARITQANRSQLIVITYELIQESIGDAINAHGDGDDMAFQRELDRAQKLLYEMMTALDMEYSVSVELMQLYSFCTKKLIQAKFQKSAADLDGVIRVLQKLQIGFEEVVKQDTSMPVMMNTQQVYAGLTYGKNSLHEVCMDGNERNRGFKA